MREFNLILASLAAQGVLATPFSVSSTATAAAPTSSNDLYPLPAGYVIEPDLYEGMTPSVPEAVIIRKRLGPFSITQGKKPTEIISTPDSTVTSETTDDGTTTTVIDSDEVTAVEREKTTPCHDCWVTAVQGNIFFTNGTLAHSAHNIKLQHITLSASSADVWCSSWKLGRPTRLYVTGDERRAIRFNGDGQKYGHYIPKLPEKRTENENGDQRNEPTTKNLEDQDSFITVNWEAVNLGPTPAEIYVDLLYEVVPNSKAKDYKKVVTIWMDIGGCGGSWGSPSKGVVDFKAYDWKSTVEGKIVLVAGHVHEGAMNTTLYLNGEDVCTLAPLYGRKRTSVDPAGIKHISDNPTCTNAGNLKQGQTLTLTTSYDFDQHPSDATLDTSTTEALMAVNIIYVGVP